MGGPAAAQRRAVGRARPPAGRPRPAGRLVGRRARTWPSSTSRTAAWPPSSATGPSPSAQALRLVEQLAEVVGYLHRQGVVHGNLKPSNVLLAADGIPRVVDFPPAGGLFQVPLPADERRPRRPRLPRPRAGPRARRGAAPHTDIYGLGVILYELLTGRPPFARRHRGGNAGAGAHREPGPALPPQPRGDAAPGGVLPALPAEEPVAALPPRLRPAQAPAVLPGQPGRGNDVRSEGTPAAALTAALHREGHTRHFSSFFSSFFSSLESSRILPSGPP